METKAENPKKVEELKHFPFENFKEFRKAYLEGIISPGVDRSVALQWSQGGIYAPTFLRIQALALVFLPFIAAIGFVIYAIVSKSWLLFLALPVLLIGYFIFHPSSAMVFGSIRTLFIFLTFAGFGWALFTHKPGLLALTIALLLIWFADRTVYKKAVSHLLSAAAEHEDLLCRLWHAKAFNIRFYNGNTYWADWKDEDGKTTHYE